LLEKAAATGVPAAVIGKTQAESLQIGEKESISVYELKLINEQWLPAYMNGEA
jgi:hypothetical protein